MPAALAALDDSDDESKKRVAQLLRDVTDLKLKLSRTENQKDALKGGAAPLVAAVKAALAGVPVPQPRNRAARAQDQLLRAAVLNVLRQG